MTSNEKRLLKDSQVAQRLGVSRATARRMRYRGQLPTVRIGRAVRIPEEALDSFVARQVGGVP